MRVVLLCHNMHTAGGYAVGINFVRALKKVDGNHKFLIIVPPGVGYEDIELPEGSEIYVYRGGRGILGRFKFDCYEVPKILKKFKADVVFGMGNLGVTAGGVKQAILFHDSHMIYPRKHFARETKKSLFKKWLVKKRMKQCLRYTDIVFCQTPVTRERFSKVYNFPFDRIKIMHNAVSQFAKAAKEETDKPEIFTSSPKYFNLFMLSKFCAHKNFESLIEIFRKFQDKLSDFRCIITIAADQHPNAPKFLKDVERYDLQGHIVNVGPLRQEELAGYFYNSDAMFFPTTLESFSGTYLEAMHFGLPIITSDLDFAHYVCDKAAIYFNPWDANDAVEKILEIKNNAKLREHLIVNGRERIKMFFKNWDEIARETITELEKLSKEG